MTYLPMVDNDKASSSASSSPRRAGSRISVEIALEGVRDMFSAHRADRGDTLDVLRHAVLELCGAAHEDRVPVETLLPRLKACLGVDPRGDPRVSDASNVVRSRVVALTIAGYYASTKT